MQKHWLNGRIKPDKTGHFFEHSNGTPFFYLADTAWDFFHGLTESETRLYLKDRASKGFNTIQVVAISENYNYNPSISGEEPFLNNDISKPNPKFFEFMKDRILMAAEYNLYIMLLPTWAEYVTTRETNIAMFTTKEAGYRYGKYLGDLLADCDNVL